MTFSSHPIIKLLLAVMVAIVVGIILDSWGWGIATFFIAMFLFIFVASWIFGGRIKGKVEVTEELEEVLNKLGTIGKIKIRYLLVPAVGVIVWVSLCNFTNRGALQD